jgi:hypothetical protein
MTMFWLIRVHNEKEADLEKFHFNRAMSRNRLDE